MKEAERERERDRKSSRLQDPQSTNEKRPPPSQAQRFNVDFEFEDLSRNEISGSSVSSSSSLSAFFHYYLPTTSILQQPAQAPRSKYISPGEQDEIRQYTIYLGSLATFGLPSERSTSHPITSLRQPFWL